MLLWDVLYVVLYHFRKFVFVGTFGVPEKALFSK